MKTFYLTLLLTFALVSCSEDAIEDNNPTNESPTETISIELSGVKDIFPTWAKFQGKIIQNNTSNREVGFVISTNQNPIINNSSNIKYVKRSFNDNN